MGNPNGHKGWKEFFLFAFSKDKQLANFFYEIVYSRLKYFYKKIN